MTIFSIILFVLSSSIDSFTVSVAYGCKNIKIGFLSNLAIAIISTLGTFLAMVFGKSLLSFLSINAANLIGTISLLTIGGYFLYDYLKNSRKINSLEVHNETVSASEILKYPEIADTDKSGSIELGESLMLAFALSLNNLALGISASVAGLSLEPTIILTFIFSLILIPLGVNFSKRLFSTFIGEKASLISSIIIIIIAVINLF